MSNFLLRNNSARYTFDLVWSDILLVFISPKNPIIDISWSAKNSSVDFCINYIF
jgi:hypothetical protein